MKEIKTILFHLYTILGSLTIILALGHLIDKQITLIWILSPLFIPVMITLIWLARIKPAELFIILMYVVALLPLIVSFSGIYFCACGFLLGNATVISRLLQSDEKAKTFYEMLCGVVIVLSIVILIFNHNLKPAYTDWDLCKLTILCGLLGMCSAAIAWEIIHKKDKL